MDSSSDNSVVESPAAAILEEMRSRSASRTAWSIGRYLDANPFKTPKELYDEDASLSSYIEWIGLGEQLLSRELRESEEKGFIHPKLYTLYAILAGEKRNLISLLRTSKKRGTDDIFASAVEGELVGDSKV